ncbi:MAG: hypothetical protein ACRD1L_10190, partial [Terriglobales bacterium]
GLGGGIVGGASAEAGLGNTGVGAQASTGGGGFITPDFAFSFGGFASGGAIAELGSHATGLPRQDPTLTTFAGAYAGAGVGGYVTDAGRAGQLRGPFLTFTASLGGTIGGSLQLQVDSHGTFLLSYEFGPGIGASFSAYMTSTGTLGGACP